MSVPGPSTRDDGFEALAAELTRRVVAAGVGQALTDEDFGVLASRVFRFQYDHNATYRAFCARRGVSPVANPHWTELPAVPAAAFKRVSLISGGPEDAQATFRTSGTTRGSEQRGVHEIRDLDLYHAVAAASFSAHLLPDRPKLRMLSLVPSAVRQPESSLSHMVSHMVDRFGAEGSAYLVDPDSGLDTDALEAAAARASDEGSPVLILGTAFSFVHAADALGAAKRSLRLPTGSRIMETGGFKGRSRSMDRSALYALLGAVTGIAPHWIVNEYGMTELLSQFYDGVAGRAGPPEGGSGEGRVHRPPPWVRSRVLDPVTLRPAAEPTPGILAHFDLANLGSVSSVLTEDLAVAREGGFRLLGRSPEAEPRGCSIAMDDLLSSVEGHR